MKKWILAILTVALAACDGGGGGGGGTPAAPAATPTAVTPLSQSCLNGTANCNSSIYYTTQGFYPYGYKYTYGRYNYRYDYTRYFNANGFCDCPTGYYPIYNATYGLGCIRQTYLQPYSGFFLTVNWGNTSTPWGYGTINNSGLSGSLSFNWYDPTVPRQWGPGPMNYQQTSNIPRYNGSCPRSLAQSCLLNQANTCGNGATCRQVLQGSNLGVCVSPN